MSLRDRFLDHVKATCIGEFSQEYWDNNEQAKQKYTEWLESQLTWRSVEDELPEEKAFGFGCLVYDLEFGVEFAIYEDGKFRQTRRDDALGDIFVQVTHWKSVLPPMEEK